MGAPSHLSPNDAIAGFFEQIAPFEDAYTDPAFHFVAVLSRSEWRLLKARLILEPVEALLQPKAVMASNVIAGQFRLSELKLQLPQFLLEIAGGRLRTPMGEISIAHVHDTVAFQPYGSEGDKQARSVSLAFFAGYPQFDRSAVDWQLRAQAPPYHDLTELASDFGVAPLADGAAVVDVTAISPVWVDYSSPVTGTAARPTIRLSQRLDPQHVSVGLRVLTGHGQIDRQRVDGSQLKWQQDEKIQNVLVGTFELTVPEEAVIGCYAAYRGVGLHFGFLQDPANVVNPNLAVVDAFDRGLGITRELMRDEPTKKGWQKNDLEDAVATVLWIMGFAVSQIGRNRLTTDAPDLVARTPRGNYLIVEVTTGILKAENKLANLVQRTAQVRQRLSRSWHRNAKVQPVLVTSLPREQVELERTQAEIDGVRVFTREDLDEAIEQRIRFPSNPDELFDELEAYLREKKEEAADAGAQLPLPGVN